MLCVEMCSPEAANVSLKNDCFGRVVLCCFVFQMCCCCLAFLSISWSDCSCTSSPIADKQNEAAPLTVASVQHDSWATLGFLRGVASPSHSSVVFCTPRWIQLLLGITEATLPSVTVQKSSPRSLVQQVSYILETKCTLH